MINDHFADNFLEGAKFENNASSNFITGQQAYADDEAFDEAQLEDWRCGWLNAQAEDKALNRFPATTV